MPKYFLFFFISINLYSQNINEELDNAVNTLKLLNNFNKKESYLDSIIKNSNDLETQCFVNYSLGRLYYTKKVKLKTAKKYFLIAKGLLVHSNNLDKKYNTFLNLGHVNLKLNKGDSALYYYNNALKISQNTKNSLLISRVYSNIARLYGKENNKKLAINYFYKSISIGKTIDRNLCTTYNNLGVVFLDINNDSAIHYFKKSLTVAKKYKKINRELRAYVNLGITFLNDSANYGESFYYLNKGNKLAIKLRQNKYLYYINYNLGKYYYLKQDYTNSINFYEKALSSKFSKNEYEQQIELLKQLSIFHEKQGNYKKANSFQKQHYHLKDSIYTLEKNKAFNDIQTKYEVEKKDNKINLLTKQKQLEQSRKKTILIIATSILLLLLLITYILKNKIKNQKTVQENKQKLFTQELKTKKALSLIEGQENERTRLAKELHDGLGGQLAGIKSIIQTISTENIKEKTIIVDKHLSTSIKSLRNISHDLSAKFLKNKDFDILIQQLIKQSFENITITSEISIFPTQKINELFERYKLNIYRVLQESFQNIIKHANANFVSVSILIDKEINILIEDNGIGFNTNIKTNGIGLQNIKDRIQSLNGTLHVDSKVNKGTTLNINIPYND